MPQATKKMLREFIKEETATAKLYARLGYPKQAREEAQHACFFKKQLTKLLKLNQ